MQIKCAHDALVKIEDLKPSPENENEHSEAQVKRLAEILIFQGIRKPIVVSNQSGFMVTGHCTLEAAKLNSAKEMPVDFQDFESSDQETAHRIADNALTLWAILNIGKINAKLPEILLPSLDLLGIKDFDANASDKKRKPIVCKSCGHDSEKCNLGL